MDYGPSGAGKTWFNGTAGERTWYLNIGEGIETLKSPLFRHKHKGPKYVIDLNERIEKMDEKQIKQYAFDLVADAIDLGLSSANIDKWDTCVLDDATFFRREALIKGSDLNTVQRKEENKRPSKEEEYFKTEIDDYGVEMDMIKWFLGTYIPKFKAHNKHFIMSAHERHIYDKPPKIGEMAPLRIVLPGFTGKTHPYDVMGFFDDVWYFNKVGSGAFNVVYRCDPYGDEIIQAKTRHNGIFENVERNPNFLSMLARIKEGKLNPYFTQRR